MGDGIAVGCNKSLEQQQQDVRCRDVTRNDFRLNLPKSV